MQSDKVENDLQLAQQITSNFLEPLNWEWIILFSELNQLIHWEDKTQEKDWAVAADYDAMQS